MSTTFKVKLLSENDEELYEAVARRTSHGIMFTSPLASLLPDDLPVIAWDNSSQGIETIGDIKKQIKKQNENNT